MTNMTICQCLTLTGDDETMTQRAELQIAVQNTALVFISEGKKRSARCRFFFCYMPKPEEPKCPPPPHTHTRAKVTWRVKKVSRNACLHHA